MEGSKVVLFLGGNGHPYNGNLYNGHRHVGFMLIEIWTLAQTVNDNLSGYDNGQPFTVGYVAANYQVRLSCIQLG